MMGEERSLERGSRPGKEEGGQRSGRGLQKRIGRPLCAETKERTKKKK